MVVAFLRLMLDLGEHLGAGDIHSLLLDIEEIALLEAWLAKVGDRDPPLTLHSQD